MRRYITIVMYLAACQGDYHVHAGNDPVPVAEPPGAEPTDHGSPPGYVAEYFNLPADHPDVEPIDADPRDDPFALDWWDDHWAAFATYDPTLDRGANWWPVDEGLAADPAYFSARWLAWIRAEDDGPAEFSFGASDDAWVFVDDELVLALPGVHPFDPETASIDLETGQYPLEIRFAHRSGDSGLRFRPLSEHLSICYPDLTDG